jgi:hypothetical protein
MHPFIKALRIVLKNSVGEGNWERPPSRYYIKKRPKHGLGRENPPNPSPPSLAGRHRPLCNGPAGGWRAGRNPEAGGAQRGDFFNQAQNSPPMEIEPGTWRCYSEALTIALEALSH